MTAETQIDYTAVLEDLENDRAELDALIAYIKRKKLGQGEASNATQGLSGTGIIQGGRTITRTLGTGMINFNAPDAYFGLGLIDAAKKYLASVKAPKTAREIAEALVSGGFTTTSKDFKNTVFSVLFRESKQDGTLVKVNTGWGLTEWYPGLRRGSKTPKPAPTSTDEESSIDPLS